MVTVANTISNAYYKAIGLVFLFLGKAKHFAQGYVRTRAFSTAEIPTCVDYDIKVVDEWLEALEGYTHEGADQIRGARILELGPGADFGVPLYLLSKGISQYCSIDAFPLALRAPTELHEAMLERIGRIGSITPIQELRKALAGIETAQSDSRSILRYIVREDFGIADSFEAQGFDFVFSQAAFEHFDDVDDVVRQVSKVARPGARLVAGVDLKTHARWLRDKDPLNIYRFSECTYRLLGFRTMPNRMSASDYERILTKYGWKDIEFRNVNAVDDEYFERVKCGLNPAYRKDETRMLWFMVCAIRA